ncbi:hypothetical protein ACD661_00725 [Legionella lytica]|uniref:Uncharacterized protein n=1 Tax=Legionella lytica TaxID=96232 RepID=A0ABW8D653_9GAMM
MHHQHTLLQDSGTLLSVLRTYWQQVVSSPFILPNEKERAQNILDFIISSTSDEFFLKRIANPQFLHLIELYALYKGTYVLDTPEQEVSYHEMMQILKSRVELIPEPLSIFEQTRSQVGMLSVQAQDTNIDNPTSYIDFLIKLQTCSNDAEFFAMINNDLLSSWELQLFQRLEFLTARQIDKQEYARFRQLIDGKGSYTPSGFFMRKAEIMVEKIKIEPLLRGEATSSSSETRKKVSLIYLFRQHLNEELSIKIKLEGLIEDNQFFDLLSKNTFNLSLKELLDLDVFIQANKNSLSEEQLMDFSMHLDSVMDYIVRLNVTKQVASNSQQAFVNPDDDFWSADEDGELEDDDIEKVAEDEEKQFSWRP